LDTLRSSRKPLLEARLKAGIESGDIITAVKGQSIRDARELARTIGGLAPGNAVKLDVLHKGNGKVVNLALGQLPNAQEAKAESTLRTSLFRRQIRSTSRNRSRASLIKRRNRPMGYATRERSYGLVMRQRLAH